MALICNGFGRLDGKERENIGGDDGCENDGGNRDGNDEGRCYSGCTFGVYTCGDGVFSNGAIGNSCDPPPEDSGGKQQRCENYTMPRPLRPFPT